MSVYLKSYSSNKQLERQTHHFDVTGSVKWKIPFLSARENFGNSNRNFWLNGSRPNSHASALADHVASTGHHLKWDHFDILARGQSDIHCKIKETFLIRDLKPAMNDQRQGATKVLSDSPGLVE